MPSHSLIRCASVWFRQATEPTPSSSVFMNPNLRDESRRRVEGEGDTKDEHKEVNSKRGRLREAREGSEQGGKEGREGNM